MAAAVECSLPCQRLDERPYLQSSAFQDPYGASPAPSRQTYYDAPAPSTSFVEALLPNHGSCSPSIEASRPAEEVPQPDLTALPSKQDLGWEEEAQRDDSETDGSHIRSNRFSLSEDYAMPGSSPNMTMYPPPVEPTQAYQPPAPPLTLMTASGRRTTAKRPVSKLQRWSWHPSARASMFAAAPSWDTPDKADVDRAGSIGSNSRHSADSAANHVPETHRSAHGNKSVHRRQESDPKYVRFVSNISKAQKETESGRCGGYPGLASHMTATQSLIVRRFDHIHVRLLLYLQEQIAQLEAQLGELDDPEVAENRMRHSFSYEEDSQVRVEIMERLRVLVGEYDTMILAFSRIQESPASEKAVGKLKDWLRKHSRGSNRLSRLPPARSGVASASEELDWIGRATDLTSLNSTTTTGTTLQDKRSSISKLFPNKKW